MSQLVIPTPDVIVIPKYIRTYDKVMVAVVISYLITLIFLFDICNTTYINTHMYILTCNSDHYTHA